MIRGLPFAMLLCFFMVPACAQSMNGKAAVSGRYPNELPGFRFYQGSKWKALQPLTSTMQDVRKVMGEPSEANDVAAFTKPYPGDLKAKKPVFTYQLNSDWELLVYFVKYCFQGYVPLPADLDDRVCSLDLIPKTPVHFQQVTFPSIFKSKHEVAVDGAWTEYDDGLGLFYEVYTNPGPYDKKTKPGDLSRIV